MANPCYFCSETTDVVVCDANECDYDVCANCVVSCSEDGCDDNVCPDCTGACSVCDGGKCGQCRQECLTKCDVCKDKFCIDMSSGHGPCGTSVESEANGYLVYAHTCTTCLKKSGKVEESESLVSSVSKASKASKESKAAEEPEEPATARRGTKRRANGPDTRPAKKQRATFHLGLQMDEDIAWVQDARPDWTFEELRRACTKRRIALSAIDVSSGDFHNKTLMEMGIDGSSVVKASFAKMPRSSCWVKEHEAKHTSIVCRDDGAKQHWTLQVCEECTVGDVCRQVAEVALDSPILLKIEGVDAPLKMADGNKPALRAFGGATVIVAEF